MSDFQKFFEKMFKRLTWRLNVSPREPRFPTGQGAPVLPQMWNEPEFIYRCKFCGAPTNVDPSDQVPPPSYCHPEDHQMGSEHCIHPTKPTPTGRIREPHFGYVNPEMESDLKRTLRASLDDPRFLGPRRNTMLDLDFSQVEARILRAFNLTVDKQGSDTLHDIWGDVAARVYGIRPQEVTPTMRRDVKGRAMAVLYSDRPPFTRPATKMQLAQYLANRIKEYHKL